MARKAKRQDGGAASHSAAIPAGFRRVERSGSFPQNWDFRKNATLVGMLQEVKTTEQKRGRKIEPVKIAYIAEGETGEVFAVWESHALMGLFEEAKPGDEVFIQFHGVKKLPGKKTMKDFSVAIREGKKRK